LIEISIGLSSANNSKSRHPYEVTQEDGNTTNKMETKTHTHFMAISIMMESLTLHGDFKHGIPEILSP